MNPEILAFGQVALVDISLAGDNAVVIGALAANLPEAKRNTALVIGIGLAVVVRILLSLGASWILTIPGVMILGGNMLLWIAWKMWRDLRREDDDATGKSAPDALDRAVYAIVLADISMSLDNVLGVAGAAEDHTAALVLGLIFSVVLMGVLGALAAKAISKNRWIGYVGVAFLVFVAARMLWHGADPLIHNLAIMEF